MNETAKARMFAALVKAETPEPLKEDA